MLDHLSKKEVASLEQVYQRAQSIGLLGPGPVRAHIEHAHVFFDAWTAASPSTVPLRALDLGSGAGVPGLILAVTWPDSHWFLLDAMERRSAFLQSAIVELGLLERVKVIRGRAEELAREDQLRHSFDLVTSRGFGGPATTAECATGFLKQAGLLVTSEPPVEIGRWNEQGLQLLGMRRILPEQSGAAILNQELLCSDVYPRRTGLPNKRPLFA